MEHQFHQDRCWLIKRVVFIALAALTLEASAFASDYYIDSDYTGSVRTGAASTPWLSLNDSGAWSTINTTLLSQDVNVWFSARKAASDADMRSSVAISLNRTDGGTHVLTLDGMSKYSTSDSSPSWSSYSGTSRFRIRISGQAAVIAAPGLNNNYITFNGFHVQSNNQIFVLGGVNHLIFTNNTGYVFNGSGYSAGTNIATTCSSGTGFTMNINAVDDLGGITSWSMNSAGTGYTDGQNCTINGGNNDATVQVFATTSPGPVTTFRFNSIGPGLSIGGTCNNLEYIHCPDWNRHVVIQNNIIHSTFGEGIYVGGSVPDPPDSTGIPIQTGDDILISGNTLYDCGYWGGDGDCIDVKDGNTNLRITGNTIYYTAGYGSPTDRGEQCQAFTIESASLINQNFVWTDAGANCNGRMLEIAEAYQNSKGREGLTLHSNILVGNGKQTVGLNLDASNPSRPVVWQYMNFYNNDVDNAQVGASIGASAVAGNTVAFQNNIVINSSIYDFATAGGGGSAYTLTHSNNLYWRASGDIRLFTDWGTFWNCSTLTGFEATALCLNPQFVSTSAPYVATNFELTSTSAAIGNGSDLSASFDIDYSNNTRSVPWDLGAWVQNQSNTAGPKIAGTGTLKASYVGATGQDYVRPQGQLTPDGVADWHIQLQGLRGIPTRVQITSPASGIWEAPYNGLNWVLFAQYGTSSGIGDVWFEPWSSPGFHVKVWYSDSTTDEADAS